MRNIIYTHTVNINTSNKVFFFKKKTNIIIKYAVFIVILLPYFYRSRINNPTHFTGGEETVNMYSVLHSLAVYTKQPPMC